MYVSYAILLLLTLDFSQAQGDVCIPVASNLSQPDSGNDIAAIDAALRQCGEGGTILIPSSKLYQIGAPLDLSPCHGCTIQVDGTLNVSTVDKSLWYNQPAIFQLSGASNIVMNGTGLINGNTFSNVYQKPNTMFSITSASQIRISGLTLRSPATNFFVIRNSQDIQFSSLSLATNLDPNAPVSYSSWIKGFEIVDSSHIGISSQTSITGVAFCVLVGEGVNSTSVSNLSCAGSESGVFIDLTSSKYLDIHLANLSFTNLTIVDAYRATGIRDTAGTTTAENVTWENVQVRKTWVAAYVENCVGSGCGGGINGARFQFQNFSFVGIEGPTRIMKSLWSCPFKEGLFIPRDQDAVKVNFLLITPSSLHNE
ncbi:hypothetical protein N0V90_009080 [Kalmusia sp. IMI 367209]|nr:hypothetical protein N0V90_009080 [Kalmusia sp. IMI 367209]